MKNFRFYTPRGLPHDYCETATPSPAWMAPEGHFAWFIDVNTGASGWMRSNGRKWSHCDTPEFAKKTAQYAEKFAE